MPTSLNKSSLSDIHKLIYGINDISVAAAIFNAEPDELEERLALNNTCFKDLHLLAIDVAAEQFNLDYYNKPKVVRVDLSTFSRSDIAKIVDNSGSISDAAKQLKVGANTLKSYCTQIGLAFRSLPSPYPYNKLVLCDDDTIAAPISVAYSNMSLRMIHQKIRQEANSLADAASRFFRIDSSKLAHDLGMIGTNFTELKRMVVKDAKTKFGGDYELRLAEIQINVPKVDLVTKTLRDIHPLCIKGENVSKTAILLHVLRQELQSYLAQRGVSFDELRGMETPEEAEKKWGDIYNSLIAIPKTDIARETLRRIHRAIIDTVDTVSAAAVLGVSSGQLLYTLERRDVSFDQLKKMTVEDAEIKFSHYNDPLKKTDMDLLLEKTFHEIHQVVTTYKIDIAVTILGVRVQSLEEYLADRGTSYQALLLMGKEEAEKKFGYTYYNLPVWKEVDLLELALPHIQKKILEADSLFSLALLIGMKPDRLKNGLQNINCNFNTLKEESLSSKYLDVEEDACLKVTEEEASAKAEEALVNAFPLLDKFKRLLSQKKVGAIIMWGNSTLQRTVISLDDKELTAFVMTVFSWDMKYIHFIKDIVSKIKNRDVLIACLNNIKSDSPNNINSENDQKIKVLQAQINRLPSSECHRKNEMFIDDVSSEPQKKAAFYSRSNDITFYNRSPNKNNSKTEYHNSQTQKGNEEPLSEERTFNFFES